MLIWLIKDWKFYHSLIVYIYHLFKWIGERLLISITQADLIDIESKWEFSHLETNWAQLEQMNWCQGYNLVARDDNNANFNTRFVQTFPILHWLVPKLEKFKAAICWKSFLHNTWRNMHNSKCASGGFHMWADQLMWLGRKWAQLIRTSVIRILWNIKPPFFMGKLHKCKICQIYAWTSVGILD